MYFLLHLFWSYGRTFEYVDIENLIISVKYVNNDGSVITEKSFDKSILEETTSDVNSSDEKSV